MIALTPAQVPADHPYYRTSSPAYRAYVHSCGPSTLDAPKGGFGWIKNLMGLVCLAKFERLPAVPSVEALKAAGFTRGWVIWIPARTSEPVPAGWRKIWPWMRTHLMSTGFTVVDGPDYAAKWNQRARRALKKFRSVPDARVVPLAHDDFAAAFLATRVSHPFRGAYVKYFRKLSAIDPSSVRAWGVEYRGKIVCGLAVHDYAGNSSAHLVAFTSKAAKPIQAGTALMDAWFSDSLAKGIKYVNFDHLRDAGMTRDQQGYTDFKNNFMEYSVTYRDSYFRWVS